MELHDIDVRMVVLKYTMVKLSGGHFGKFHPMKTDNEMEICKSAFDTKAVPISVRHGTELGGYGSSKPRPIVLKNAVFIVGETGRERQAALCGFRERVEVGLGG